MPSGGLGLTFWSELPEIYFKNCSITGLISCSMSLSDTWKLRWQMRYGALVFSEESLEEQMEMVSLILWRLN